MRRRKAQGGGGHGEEEVPWASFADATIGLLFVFILLTVYFVAKAQNAYERLAGREQAARKIQRELVDEKHSKSVTYCLNEQFANQKPGIPLEPRGDPTAGRISLYFLDGKKTLEWFETASARLNDEQAQAACEIGSCLQAAMQALPDRENHLVQVFVEGHTDSWPIAGAQFPSNWELSAARAAAVLRTFMPSYDATPESHGSGPCHATNHTKLLDFVDLGQLEVVAVGRADQDPAWVRVCEKVKGLEPNDSPCGCETQTDKRGRAECLKGKGLSHPKLIEWANASEDGRRHMRRVDLRFEVRPLELVAAKDTDTEPQ
jgi:hypothetical protein